MRLEFLITVVEREGHALLGGVLEVPQERTDLESGSQKLHLLLKEFGIERHLQGIPPFFAYAVVEEDHEKEPVFMTRAAATNG